MISKYHFTVAFEQSTGTHLIQLDFSTNLYCQLARKGSVFRIIGDVEHQIGNQLRSKLVW